MADHSDPSPRSERLARLAAVGLLAVAAALAFGRVFAGHAPTLKLLAAAAISVLLAALLERRGLPLAILVSVLGLAVAIGLLVFPHTTFAGLPTRATLRAVAKAMEVVGQQARAQVAPTPPLASLLLATLAAVWTVAFSAHALAVRAGSPLLAAMPPVALLGFADVAMNDGHRPVYPLLFLLAALAVALLEGLRRVRQWGPLWPWPGARRRRLSATATRGARRVIAVTVGVAALLPGLLPGLRSPALLNLVGGGEGDVIAIDPLVSIKESLAQRKPEELFRVRADREAYWRMLALDRFDGTTWSTADLDLARARLANPGDVLVAPWLGSIRLAQEFRVSRDLAFTWVPAAYPPGRIDLGTAFRYDPELSTAAAPEPLRGGTEYSVTSFLLAPTAEDLAAVRFGPSSLYRAYTSLPPDTPPEIFDIAAEWAREANTPFRQMLTIQERLRTDFVYDEQVPARSDSFTLVDFLTETRRGFCQQFASAMAVLVRALGYPARVAVGFTPGTLDNETDEYRVTTENAHSWVEVFFPGYGWMAFEPTPTRSNPVAEAYLAPPTAACPPGAPGCPVIGDPDQPGARQPFPRWLMAELEGQGPAFRGGRFGFGRRGIVQVELEPGIPWGTIAAAVAGAAILAALLVPPVRAGRRRLRLRRAVEPRTRVLATYDVFLAQAADLGLRRSPGETPDEYRRRLARARATDGHLSALTGLAVRAAYSPGPVDPEEAARARAAARDAIRELRRQTGLLRRLAGAFRPSW